MPRQGLDGNFNDVLASLCICVSTHAVSNCQTDSTRYPNNGRCITCGSARVTRTDNKDSWLDSTILTLGSSHTRGTTWGIKFPYSLVDYLASTARWGNKQSTLLHWALSLPCTHYLHGLASILPHPQSLLTTTVWHARWNSQSEYLLTLYKGERHKPRWFPHASHIVNVAVPEKRPHGHACAATRGRASIYRVRSCSGCRRGPCSAGVLWRRLFLPLCTELGADALHV